MKEAEKRDTAQPKRTTPVATQEDEETAHREKMLDEAIEESFPASDPSCASEPGSHYPDVS